MIALPSPSSTVRRSRWALSLADLCLLLLGFFVLLQASGQKRDTVVASVGSYFGAVRPAADRDLPARTLFLPGEAILSDAGGHQLAGIAREAQDGKARLELLSIGRDRPAHGRAGQRFDSWDLAAARLGAVARALQAGGVPAGRIALRGLDDVLDAQAGKDGQIIRIHVVTKS